MRKAQIERLRKIVREKSGAGASGSGTGGNADGIAPAAREAASTPSEAAARQIPCGLPEADRRLLERFYAARLAGRDWDRSLAPTARRLASMAFEEAVASLHVWKREIGRASAAIASEGGKE